MSKLLDSLRKNKESVKGRGKVQFLALKPDIEEALEAGFPVKSIWKALKEKNQIDLSYPQFALYVRTHINQLTAEPKPEKRPTDIKNYNPNPDKSLI